MEVGGISILYVGANVHDIKCVAAGGTGNGPNGGNGTVKKLFLGGGSSLEVN